MGPATAVHCNLAGCERVEVEIDDVEAVEESDYVAVGLEDCRHRRGPGTAAARCTVDRRDGFGIAGSRRHRPEVAVVRSMTADRARR